jgi:DNA-binding beta-propeller fold protein YncE
VAVAVNYATDKIYAVYNNPNGELIEIDGASNKVVHKMAIAQPASAIAVDATLNRIYVLGASYSAGTGEPYAYSVLNGNIYVVNGKTNELVQTIPDLNYSIAVDVLTGRLWAANLLPIGGSGTVAQINLASDKTVSSVSLEATQFGQIAVDPVRNVAYSLGQYGRITVLSGR